MGVAGVRVRAAVAVFAAVTTLAAPVRAEEPDVVGGPRLGSRTTVTGAGAPRLPAVSAAAWVVADADTGAVLGARNAHGTYLPASTMKTLTAVALIPEMNLKAKYKATQTDANIEGSKVGIVAGTTYTVDKLMEAMLVVSGNDAAHAIAGAYGGMRKAVAQMNATAQRLQAYDTVARNTSGLDAPGQVTSAYDLALITRAGLRLPAYQRYGETLRGTMPAPGGKRFEIYNHNKLLTRYRGAIGGKTGYTYAARHTYVGVARRGGHTLIVTLLKTETNYPDAIALLDWGFKAVGKAAPVGRLVDPIDPEADDTADRSRVAQPVASPTAQPVLRAAPRETSRPYVPVAGGLAAAGSLVLLRRRAVRRRYGYRASGGAPKLKLPVR